MASPWCLLGDAHCKFGRTPNHNYYQTKMGRAQAQSTRPNLDVIKKILARRQTITNEQLQCPTRSTTAPKQPNSHSGVPSAPQRADLVVKELYFISLVMCLHILDIFVCLAKVSLIKSRFCCLIAFDPPAFFCLAGKSQLELKCSHMSVDACVSMSGICFIDR